MLAAIILSLICLDIPPHPPPYTVETYSVREDGAGNACDCMIAPCTLIEPECFITQPDFCGNTGPCAYLDIHIYPAAMVWRTFSVANDTCFDTDWTETRTGWGAWWRVR